MRDAQEHDGSRIEYHCCPRKPDASIHHHRHPVVERGDELPFFALEVYSASDVREMGTVPISTG